MKIKARTAGYLRRLALLSLVLLPVTAPHANAAPIGSGLCISEVTSAASVSTAISNGYCYIGFAATGTNTWTVPSGVTSIDFVVVAGGGAGGSGAWGGGGGAGGVVIYETYSVTAGAGLDLNVGTGGTPGTATLTSADNRSTSGNDSWITSASGVVAKGGGAGASYAYGQTSSYSKGSDGGSGGGGTEYSSAVNVGGSSTQTLPTGAKAKYGTSGGSGSGTSTQAGAGGGGSLTSGSPDASGIGGAGGNGTSAVATYLNAFATPFGVSSAIAGGGAGGSTSTTQALGGTGGGGKGGYTGSRAGSDGTASTGSGGGGASYNSGSYKGGAGASGLIIIRYISDTAAPIFTGSPTNSVPENTSTTTNIATIRVSESATITLSSGADSATVTLVYGDSTTAYVRFLSTPNYEAATDSGLNNIYDFTVKATDIAGNFSTQAMSITVTNENESGSIGAPSVSGLIYKGISTTITVTTNVAGNVRFFVGGKKIGNCLNRSASGAYPTFTATCSWKPPVRGDQALTATLNPTDSTFSSSTTTPTKVFVLTRTTKR